jgi:hypothetical protein
MLTAAQEALNAQHAAANSVRETQEREARWKMREIDLPKLKEQEKLHETFAKFDLGMKENLASFTEGLREKYDLAKKAQEGDKFDKQESSIIALMRTTLAFLDKAEYMTSQPKYRRFMWTAEGVKEKLLPKGAQSQDFTDWDNLVNQEAVRIGGLLSKSGAMARILTTQAGQDLMRSLSMSSWRQNPGQVDSAIRTARAHAVDVIRGIRDTANSGNRATPATDALLDAEWKRQEGFFHQPGEQPKEAPPPASRPATGTFKLNNGKTYKQTVDKNGNITVIEVKGP